MPTRVENFGWDRPQGKICNDFCVSTWYSSEDNIDETILSFFENFFHRMDSGSFQVPKHIYLGDLSICWRLTGRAKDLWELCPGVVRAGVKEQLYYVVCNSNEFGHYEGEVQEMCMDGN